MRLNGKTTFQAGAEDVGIDEAESTQLANIGTTEISATEWGYVGAMDQGVATSNAVQFTSITAQSFNLATIGTGSFTATGGHGLITGETGASGQLILRSTSNATKGSTLVDETTTSTSATTGALVVSGGVGIAENIYTGGNVGFTASGGSIVPSVGGIIITSGDQASESLTLRSTSNATKGSIKVDETTASTSKTTGALIVSGGLGVAGSVFCNSITPGDINLTAGGGTQNISATGGTASVSAVSITSAGTIQGSGNDIAITGGTAASANLILRSTTNATKGSVKVDETTTSTSATTGALVVSGGVGIAENIYTGGNVGFTASGGTIVPSVGGIILTSGDQASESLTLRSTSNATKGSIKVDETTTSTSATTGALVVSGGIGIAENIYTGGNVGFTASGGTIVPSVGGIILTSGDQASESLTLRSTSNITKGSIKVDETTASTSKTTGALIVSGGLGVAGSVFCNSITPGDIDLTSGGGTQNISATGGTASVSAVSITSAGTIQGSGNDIAITGGTAASANLILRSTTNATKGSVKVDETTTSTSATTGALVVSGGVGIAENIYTGGNAGFTASGGTMVPSASGIIITSGDLASQNLTLRSTTHGTKGHITIDETTVSSSTATGALVVSGGVGVAGRITSGGSIDMAVNTYVGSGVGTANTTGLRPGTNTCSFYTDAVQRMQFASGGVCTYNLATEATAYNAASVLFTGGIGVAKKVITNSTITATEFIPTTPVGGWFYVNATYTTGSGLLTTPAVLAIPYVEGMDTGAYWTPNSGANGVIEYTNATTRYFHICMQLTIGTNTGAASTIQIQILKDGVAITGATVKRYLMGPVDTGEMCCYAHVSLANTNKISLQISSTLDAPTYEVLHGSISITPSM